MRGFDFRRADGIRDGVRGSRLIFFSPSRITHLVRAGRSLPVVIL